MKCSHWMTAAAAVLVLAASAPAARTAPVPAETSPLAQVPATAPVVIHINGLETVRDHVVAFLKNAVPDQADVRAKAVGRVPQERLPGPQAQGPGQGRADLRGVHRDCPRQARATNAPNALALIAAVTDYAEFRDNILSDDEKKNLKTGDGFESTASDMGGDVFFVDRKDYVVVTPSKDVAEAFGQGAGGGPGRQAEQGAGRQVPGQRRRRLREHGGRQQGVRRPDQGRPTRRWTSCWRRRRSRMTSR